MNVTEDDGCGREPTNQLCVERGDWLVDTKTMAEWIGVTGPHFVASSLKRELLLFDRLAYPRIDKTLDAFATNPAFDDVAPEFVNDLTWLSDHGIVFDPFSNLLPVNYPSQSKAALDLFFERYRKLSTLGRSSLDDPQWSAEDNAKLVEVLANGLSDLNGLAARALAPVLVERMGVNAVPICEVTQMTLPAQVREGREGVLRIVISNLPIPGDQHSLEDVLAFREETRAQGLLQGLRVWINEMALGTLKGVELSDKLEDLFSQYERTLKLEKMNRDTTWLETFVFPAKGVTEYMTTLASKLFTVKRAEIDLLKAEMNAPGREVAHIVKARERFGR
jgi:hypothetical protein